MNQRTDDKHDQGATPRKATALCDLMREHAEYMATYSEPFVGSTEAIARHLRKGADYIDQLERELASKNAIIEKLLHEDLSARPSLATTGAMADVAAERQRQIDAEGYDHEHDDQHDTGGLAAAAWCYVHSALCEIGKPKAPVPAINAIPAFWPWEDAAWKPKGARRNLIRAAALIVAEIERMDRRGR